MSAPLNPTFAAPTVPPTELCPCFVSSTTLPATSIRAAESARAALLHTSSPGTLISSPFWTCAKTTETRWNAPAISSTPSGSPISSWSVSKTMELGPSCVPTNVRDLTPAGAMSSRPSTKSTRRRARGARLSRRSSSGLLSWTRRWRRELPTCSTRMPATERATSRTWVLSSAPTSVRRLLSTLLQMRLPCATLPVSAFPNLSLPRTSSAERDPLIWII
mmetsp:Transcript_43409/g.91174  ORF Transcript_43409/g.91174 Transcript_43409/m.91174 type:complete len:219 (+) Transcript_43409:826-1482(+)